jgi:uncharacterized protein (DUF1697 family)
MAMADLRALMEALQLENGQTLLQSGNLIFRGGARAGAALERQLEEETARRFGLETDYFVRSADEWRAVVARNPFREAARRDPSHLVVMFLKAAVGAEPVAALQAAIVGREVVRGAGREIYVTYPDGIGRSRLTSAVIERKLGTRATGRNWNTVLKLAALAGA